MFNLESTHVSAVLLAMMMATLIHFSMWGVTRNIFKHLLLLALFPFLLTGLTLLIPQSFLQISLSLFFLYGLTRSVVSIPDLKKSLQAKFLTLSKKEKYTLGFLTLYLFAYFLNATMIRSGGSIQDALVYHLQGPKEWALFLDGAKFNANNPISYTTSYYDYYNYYFFLLVKPILNWAIHQPSTHYEFFTYVMLFVAQLFSAIIVVLYVPIMIFRLAKDFGLYKYLATFFVIGFFSFTWTWTLPKNDIFPFFCFLLSVLLLKEKLSISRSFIIGSLIGIGVCSKLTNAYVVIFSILFFFSINFKNLLNQYGKSTLFKFILVFIVGGLVGSSAFLMRNATQTNNPFFPIAKFGFPNVYVSDYADRPELYSDPTTWKNATEKFVDHTKSNPQLILILFLALVFRWPHYTFFYLALILYMAKQTGPMYGFRMTNSLLVLYLLLFLMIGKKIMTLDLCRWNKVKIGAFVIFILACSKIQFEKIYKIPKEHYGLSVEQTLQTHHQNWNFIISDNLKNYKVKNYAVETQVEVFPYFSRFPWVSLYDSVPEYRFDYFKK
jgi:hypothetical protein